MQKLLIATTNPGKLQEIRKYLSDLPLELVGLKDVHINTHPKETGESFEENAVLKAQYYAKLSGLPTIADDGGFEIDALGGKPGVKSHRWIHGDRDDIDEELIEHTLKKMKGLPQAERGAQLRLVIAFVIPGEAPHTSEDRIRGVVPERASDKRFAGFPYRSLLFISEIGKYYNDAELTESENEAYNHRGRALEKLKPIIRKELSR